MASIQKRGSTYSVIFYHNGKQCWKVAGKKRRDAERMKTEIESSLQRGTYVEVEDVTFAALAAKWLELKKGEVRPKSFASYQPMIRRICCYCLDPLSKELVADKKNGRPNCLGMRKAKAIRQEEVEQFASKLLSAMGPDITKRTLTLYNAICSKGVQWHYLPHNPLEYVDKPKSPVKEMDFLNPEEIKKLLANTDERYRALMMFACLTGCRQSEILGLRWGDVDFTSSRIHIRQVQHGGRFYEPKTDKSRRAVVIPPVLVQELEVHRLRQSVELVQNNHDLVFPNLAGKPMNGLNVTRRVLRPALRKAGLRDIRFHDLRHSYISMLMNQGANIRFIQQQAGHSSAKVTWDRYSHVYPETEATAIATLQNVICGNEVSVMKSHPSRVNRTD